MSNFMRLWPLQISFSRNNTWRAINFCANNTDFDLFLKPTSLLLDSNASTTYSEQKSTNDVTLTAASVWARTDGHVTSTVSNMRLLPIEQ
jgi:hypothetical protein